jgi:hypothetical protein
MTSLSTIAVTVVARHGRRDVNISIFSSSRDRRTIFHLALDDRSAMTRARKVNQKAAGAMQYTSDKLQGSLQ